MPEIDTSPVVVERTAKMLDGWTADGVAGDAQDAAALVRALAAKHDARVTELLEANNREVERRRVAERERDALAARLAVVPQVVEALRVVRDSYVRQMMPKPGWEGRLDPRSEMHAVVTALAAWRAAAEAFPQPRRKPGGEPCGECHIQPGETCDICGAVRPAAEGGRDAQILG